MYGKTGKKAKTLFSPKKVLSIRSALTMLSIKWRARTCMYIYVYGFYVSIV